jgi:hypothetical protein
MSQICKLIAEEITKIQLVKTSEPGEVKPSNYQHFEENLPGQIETLKKIKKLLKLDEVILTKIDLFFLKKKIVLTTLEDFDKNLKKVVATSENEVNKDTIIYVGDLNIKDIRGHIKALPNLVLIKGSLYYSNTKRIFDLPSLKFIERDGHFSLSLINKLPELCYIGGNSWFPPEFSCPKLYFIGGNAEFLYFNGDFSSLKVIDGNAKFLSSYGNFSSLKLIRGDAVFNESTDDFGALLMVEGNADFRNCRFGVFPILQIIGKKTYVNNNTNPDLIKSLKKLGKELIY